MERETLEKILQDHLKWLEGKEDGRCACLIAESLKREN